MEFFKKYFSDVEFEAAEEVKVLCPFHSDSKPSASVNTDKDLFHCWVCDVGYNEQQFISKVNNISLADAAKVLNQMGQNTHDWFVVEKANLWADNKFLTKVEEIGLSKETIESLHLGLTKDELERSHLAIPVLYNGVIMDVRSYNLLKFPNAPKMRSKSGATSGFVIPYDVWKQDKNTTYIFEGEKDMLMARELGLNGITLTGGAGAKPNEYIINQFKDRDVVICYDNDKAGREGANALNVHLKPVSKSVKYIDISEGVEEEKEDFYDYINKYGYDVFDFYSLTEHDFNNVTITKRFNTIKGALNNNVIKKTLLSQVTVSAEYSDNYAVPAAATFTKEVETGGKTEKMFKGEVKAWYFDKKKAYQILELIEVGAKKVEVIGKLRKLAGVPAKEENIDTKVTDYRTIYKIKVVDKDGDGNNIALDLYTFEQMMVGKQFEIVYKIYPHPTKNQKLVAIATSAVEIDSQDNFTVDKKALKQFQTSGTVTERLSHLYQSAKHHVAKHLDYKIWLTVDLVFNSILEFDYGDRIRGALDIFILGDTQVGKSETASKLTELYNFGHFLSLKTSTTVGLIGGSNKVEGSWLNTIGAIPRQHKKLVVMEEFSGAKPEFIKTMTDIRSSGNLRLARAAGEMNVPCRLRMITISNPINDDGGNPRHLSTFPNGISPLMELIRSAEDVARYDGFLLVEKPKNRFNPFQYKLKGTPIAPSAYHHKINWVATRRPEDVIFSEGTESYIWYEAEKLNKLFECNFPLFGTTTSLKLARYSVALASLIVSTDEKYEKVIVTKEIVDAAVNFMNEVYNNEVFKLREYKAEYDSYNEITNNELKKFQELYNKNSVMFEFLAHQSGTSRYNLQTVAGLKGDEFGRVFNQMVKYKFLRLSSDTVFPTPKFRIGMKQVSKNFTIGAAETLIESYEV